MKNRLMLIFVVFTALIFGGQTASAQFTINIPKLPKIKKDKPKPEDSTTAQAKSDGYDEDAFREIRYANRDYINPFLECYAKKHNLELIKVTDNAFHPRDFFGKDFKKTLQEEQAKLAELEVQLKSKMKSRPNTGLPYEENPAIWEEITVNRAEYMQCATAAQEAKNIKESPMLHYALEEIAKRQKEVEDSTPDRGWLVQDYSEHYLSKAVSPGARNEYLKNIMEFKPDLDPPLDALAAAVAKKLPLFPANTKQYSIHNLAEEKLMKGQITDIASYKIFYGGLETANWLIDKNDLGIPIGKYKHGMVWLRDTRNDHPYCYAYYINVIQDYAGGGTYGASYARYIEYELVGCPAGK